MNPSETDTNSTETFSIDRRDALKLAGGAIVGVGAFAGTASASNTQFLGCSRVCTGTDEDHVVLLTGDGYECRKLDKQDDEMAAESDDLAFAAEVYACYEADEDEAIVGALHRDSDAGDDDTAVAGLCLNPNDCATEYYDSREQLLSELDCDAYDEIRTDCIGEAFDSNGEPQNGTETTESA